MTHHIKIILFISLMLIAGSCQKNTSLQEYLVESQEKNGFITIDIPTSFLQLKSEDVSDEVKATLESIYKINVVALPAKENQEAYKIERIKLKSIFKKNKKYKMLMSMKLQEMNVHVYFTGKTTSLNEIIAFGYRDGLGVGVARLLGKNMNPANIITMLNKLKIDTNNLNLEQFSAIFGK